MTVDASSLLFGLAIALLVLVALDLLVLGGAMTAGTMGGMAAMMGTPWGWAVLLAVVLLVLATLGPRW